MMINTENLYIFALAFFNSSLMDPNTLMNGAAQANEQSSFQKRFSCARTVAPNF